MNERTGSLNSPAYAMKPRPYERTRQIMRVVAESMVEGGSERGFALQDAARAAIETLEDELAVAVDGLSDGNAEREAMLDNLNAAYEEKRAKEAYAEECRRDAERYRWLRAFTGHRLQVMDRGQEMAYYDTALDAAIDREREGDCDEPIRTAADYDRVIDATFASVKPLPGNPENEIVRPQTETPEVALRGAWEDGECPQHLSPSEFAIYDGDEFFSEVSGPRERAWGEAMHYAMQCDKPRIEEIVRTPAPMGEVPPGVFPESSQGLPQPECEKWAREPKP